MMRRGTKLARWAAAALCMACPVAAQDARATNGAADALYCGERKLGYWFYCVRPSPAPQDAKPQPQPQATASAAEELDAITGELRELKAQAILHPTPENVAAYIRCRTRRAVSGLASQIGARASRIAGPSISETSRSPM